MHVRRGGGRGVGPVAAGAALALAVATATACTASSDDANPSTTAAGTSAPLGGDLGGLLPTASPEFVSQSAGRTEATDTGRLSLELRIAGTGVADGVLLEADGAFVLSDHLTELVVTPGPVGEDGGLVASRTIAHGSDVYVRDESVTRALELETDWVRYLDECGDDGLGQGLVPFAGADAIDLLEAVEATGAEVEEVGEEKVAGFPAVHFRTEVDLGAAVASASPDCQGEWAGFAGSAVPVDIWIHTESGVVMRELLTFDLVDFLERTDPESAEELAGVGGSLEYRVDFFGLGEPVEIAIPGDGDVTEVTRDEYQAATGDASATTDDVEAPSSTTSAPPSTAPPAVGDPDDGWRPRPGYPR